jgi:diguanylate cyclase (GGDEF)-like protein
MPTPPPLWTTVTAALLLAAGMAQAAAPVRDGTRERWTAWAADGFKQINTAQGLPSEVVTSVTEDVHGFLWVGTMGGVARWDGYQFVTHRFTAAPGKPAMLADNLVQVLHSDSQGRLWVGTDAVGLIRLGRGGEALRHIGPGADGLSHGSVRALADDGQGGLWVGTDRGLDHVDGRNRRVQRVPMGPDAANGLRGDNATALLRDRSGRLWVGTTAGLFMRDPGSEQFTLAALPQARGRQPQAESLLEDSAGRLWMGTNRDGVFVRDAAGGAWRPIVETQQDDEGRTLASRRVMALLEAQPGEVWAGTLGQGVVAIDAQSGHTRRLRHRPLLPSSLPDDHVRGMFRDRSVLVWVATYAGLARVDPRASAVLNVSPDRGVVDTTRSRADYASLLAHSDGRVWMGTLSHGVDIIDPQHGTLMALKADPSRPETALPPDATLGLAEGPDGSVYIGNYRGLYRAVRAPRPSSVPSVARISWPGRPADRGVGPLLRDGPRLWVGGLRDGLWEMDFASGRVRAALHDPAKQLTDLRISSLALGRDGKLWIGTRNGLNRYDPATGTVLKLAAGTAEDGLAAGYIASMHLDRRGRFWVATYGGGLHLLQDGDGPPRFSRVGATEGLPDNNVNGVVEDADGRIWASTDNGLAMVDTTTMRARGLRRAEGVGYATFWTGSVARTAAGELLFGASGGVTVVRPSLLLPWTHRPPVVVTELRVGGHSVPLPEGPAPLQVPPEANSLEVSYAALDYSAPERNRYAHRLVGHDRDWVASDAQRRLASYNNLPPGDYQLQLRGSNRDGVFSEHVLSLPVQVLAPWHQTAWFRALAGLAVLGLVYGLVHARTRVLQARRRELQRLVDERTVELQAVSLALSEKSRALEEKSRVLEHASISDPLTGLHNRRFLTEHIEAALSASLRRALAGETDAAATDTDTLFFLIDVDHFKRVNDDHGHAAGDAVLVQLAQRLKVAMRDSDDVVRWGGEEFLAVAHDTDRARADELAERLRASVADAPFRLPNGRSLPMSCSIGHACWPFLRSHPQALDWLAVVNMADVGLLTAKRLGRNAWVGLQATARAQPEGLAARAATAPQQALRDGELAFTSSHPAPAAVAEAMVAH